MFEARQADDRLHLAEDRAFFYLRSVYSNYGSENEKIALAFQREIINNIIPHVQPDLIHCNDWMTGLIPAVARQLNERPRKTLSYETPAERFNQCVASTG